MFQNINIKRIKFNNISILKTFDNFISFDLTKVSILNFNFCIHLHINSAKLKENLLFGRSSIQFPYT